MKIGIISMQQVRNYGSFLQAYGLKKILEKQGHTVGFIPIEASAQAQTVSGGQRLRNMASQLNRYLIKHLVFRKERKKISALLRSEQNRYLQLDRQLRAQECDAVVIGSDEIFNCESSGPWKITPERFGDIPEVPCVISYAASCGYTSLADCREEDRNIIAAGIRRLNAVSVRDENTAQFAECFRQDAILRHLDPVLIYDFTQEVQQGEEQGIPETPYMVVYAYHNRIQDPEEIRSIRRYAKSHGLTTVAVGGLQAWCDEYRAVTPFQVLALFKNAECVVTDTFHGTVLSAKFNKRFAVMVRPSNANKLTDLLSRLQIEAHRIDSPETLECVLNCKGDYSACNRIIARGRDAACDYLKTSLLQKEQ